MCAPLPGGYCASTCGVSGVACDGACIETGRGELCLKSCTHDDTCRTDEGYVCDPAWHACSIPNLGAIVPASCAVTGPAIDNTFGASEPWSTSALAGRYQVEPSAVLADDGSAVAIYASLDAIGAGNVLGVTRDVPLGGDRDHPDVDPRLARDRAGTLYAVWHATPASAARSCSRPRPIAARRGPRRSASAIPTTAPAARAENRATSPRR